MGRSLRVRVPKARSPSPEDDMFTDDEPSAPPKRPGHTLRKRSRAGGFLASRAAADDPDDSGAEAEGALAPRPLVYGRAWLPQEDQVLLAAVATHGSCWKQVADDVQAALGTRRSTAMCRNRYQRIRAPMQPGKEGRNRCKRCGQIKRGHTCTVAGDGSRAPPQGWVLPPRRPAPITVKPEAEAAEAEAGGALHSLLTPLTGNAFKVDVDAFLSAVTPRDDAALPAPALPVSFALGLPHAAEEEAGEAAGLLDEAGILRDAAGALRARQPAVEGEAAAWTPHSVVAVAAPPLAPLPPPAPAGGAPAAPTAPAAPATSSSSTASSLPRTPYLTSAGPPPVAPTRLSAFAAGSGVRGALSLGGESMLSACAEMHASEMHAGMVTAEVHGAQIVDLTDLQSAADAALASKSMSKSFGQAVAMAVDAADAADAAAADEAAALADAIANARDDATATPTSALLLESLDTDADSVGSADEPHGSDSRAEVTPPPLLAAAVAPAMLGAAHPPARLGLPPGAPPHAFDLLLPGSAAASIAASRADSPLPIEWSLPVPMHPARSLSTDTIAPAGSAPPTLRPAPALAPSLVPLLSWSRAPSFSFYDAHPAASPDKPGGAISSAEIARTAAVGDV